MIKTKNFNPTVDHKLLCTCGHPQCDKRSVRQDVLDKAQVAREWLGRPLTVTSGGRCPNHLEEAKRVKPADHQLSQGIDIAAHSKQEVLELVLAGQYAGFNAIGMANNFVHWGYRSELPKGVIARWVY